MEDCTPNVIALLPLLREKARRIILKLSPMLDWRKAVGDLEGVSEVHIVSVDNECKELLLVIAPEETQPLRLFCVNDGATFQYVPREGTIQSQGGNVSVPGWEQILRPVSSSRMPAL